MIAVGSVREHPETAEEAIAYIQSKWASEASKPVYEDCIRHCAGAQAPLPQWYLLYDKDRPVGCAGLITNDFISRMDLYPWVCALYVEPSHRGHHYGSLLLEKALTDARDAGFPRIYLCTDHIGYYERYGFEFIGLGYHPWGESSRIYGKDTAAGEPQSRLHRAEFIVEWKNGGEFSGSYAKTGEWLCLARSGVG